MNNNIKVLEYGKTISISQLPECRHKVRLQNIVINTNAKICVVAIANGERWEAFAGWPDIQDMKLEPVISLMDYEWNCENIRDQEQVLIMKNSTKKQQNNYSPIGRIKNMQEYNNE